MLVSVVMLVTVGGWRVNVALGIRREVLWGIVNYLDFLVYVGTELN